MSEVWPETPKEATESAIRWTPNTNVPLNNRQRGEIAPVALTQLENYQAVARDWKVWPDTREQTCMRCMECNESVYFLEDVNGEPFRYSDDEVLALTVAHIRQCHDELVSERSSFTTTITANWRGGEGI